MALLYLFIFLQEVSFLYFTVVLSGHKARVLNLHETRRHRGGANDNHNLQSHLYEEALVCARRVVGGQVSSDQQELGVIRQFDVSVSR